MKIEVGEEEGADAVVLDAVARDALPVATVGVWVPR